jgi:hypothetical protein
MYLLILELFEAKNAKFSIKYYLLTPGITEKKFRQGTRADIGFTLDVVYR